MWVMYVERVKGDYREPEIIDLKDGSGCLFRIHELDISEDGPEMLSDLLTKQAQLWAPRPPGSPRGPVIHVTWICTPNPENPFSIEVAEGPDYITYTIADWVLTQHAGDFLGRLDTERSPHWQRVPKGYHDHDVA